MARLKDLRGRLGRRVRALRQARGWTQEQFAERAALSYKFIGEIERGRGNPTLQTLISVAEALDLSVGALFGEAEQEIPHDYYTVTRRQLQVVREAADSLGSLLDGVGAGRRRRARRKLHT